MENKKMIEEAFSYVDSSSLTTFCILGQGSYGSVSLMLDTKHRRCYAKKTSSLDNSKNLEKELRIMLAFRNHPRIVQALSPNLHLGLGLGFGEPFIKDCHIFMEYASHGTLHKVISVCGGRPIREHIISLTARMILQGLDALHSRGYVHCDLKPANILLFPSTTHGEPWDLKLADFGLSMEPYDKGSRFSRPGTKRYMPPESLGPKRVVGPALDIWSLGCVVFQMFGCKPIEVGDSCLWRLHVALDISLVAIDFLMRCHTINPLRRACATELLRHPFITQSVSVPLKKPCPI